jgi:hypothetical protein
MIIDYLSSREKLCLPDRILNPGFTTWRTFSDISLNMNIVFLCHHYKKLNISASLHVIKFQFAYFQDTILNFLAILSDKNCK